MWSQHDPLIAGMWLSRGSVEPKSCANCRHRCGELIETLVPLLGRCD
jgi:hypothetical protein